MSLGGAVQFEIFTNEGKPFTFAGKLFTNEGKRFTNAGKHFTNEGKHFTLPISELKLHDFPNEKNPLI